MKSSQDCLVSLFANLVLQHLLAHDRRQPLQHDPLGSSRERAHGRGVFYLLLNQAQLFSALQYWTAKLSSTEDAFYSYSVEPFLPSHLSHANSSAWPASSVRKSGKAPSPLLVFFGWQNPANDKVFVAAVEESAKRLAVVAKNEGLLSNHPPALYGNYVDSNTPLVQIYGDNLPELRALKTKIDPNNVMGLAGGFKF